MGTEAAGVIVALPTDPAVLNHPEYKARCYAIGAKAIAVRTKPNTQDLNGLSYPICLEREGHRCGIYRHALG